MLAHPYYYPGFPHPTLGQQFKMHNPYRVDSPLNNLSRKKVKRTSSSDNILEEAIKGMKENQSLQCLLSERNENRKLKDMTTKLSANHTKEQSQLKEQITEYRETVKKQADLIAQLQKLSKMQKSLIMS